VRGQRHAPAATYPRERPGTKVYVFINTETGHVSYKTTMFWMVKEWRSILQSSLLTGYSNPTLETSLDTAYTINLHIHWLLLKRKY